MKLIYLLVFLFIGCSGEYQPLDNDVLKVYNNKTLDSITVDAGDVKLYFNDGNALFIHRRYKSNGYFYYKTKIKHSIYVGK